MIIETATEERECKCKDNKWIMKVRLNLGYEKKH